MTIFERRKNESTKLCKVVAEVRIAMLDWLHWTPFLTQRQVVNLGIPGFPIICSINLYLRHVEKQFEIALHEQAEVSPQALQAIPVTRVSNGKGGWVDLIL